jgi:hypothetical protein
MREAMNRIAALCRIPAPALASGVSYYLRAVKTG